MSSMINKLNFEMTPQLEEILQREAGKLLHPSMKSNTMIKDFIVVYHLEMELPEGNNKKEILLGSA